MNVKLDQVLIALKHYCQETGMDGMDLWYWLNTHHIRLEIKPSLSQLELEE